MSELGPLVVIVGLVYFFQCICWAPTSAVVFEAEFPKSEKRTDGQQDGNRFESQSGKKKRGFAWSALHVAGFWANPLPPLDALLVVNWPGFHLNPEAIQLGHPEAGLVSIPWEALRVSHSGSKLFCNEVPVFQGPDDQIARYQELLQRVGDAKPKIRQQMIEAWLRKAMDIDAMESRVELFRRKSWWLRIVVNLQFFLLFLVVPVVFIRFGTRALWPAIIAVLAADIVIALEFWRLHKFFYSTENEARIKSAITILFSPISAIRAMDAVVRDLLNDFHPVAVATVVCAPEQFESFAGEQLRQYKFSRSGASWFTGQMQTSLAQIVEKQGVQVKRLLAAPPQESSCVVYCPRCLAQYVEIRPACADCGYEHLLPLAAAKKA